MALSVMTAGAGIRLRSLGLHKTGVGLSAVQMMIENQLRI